MYHYDLVILMGGVNDLVKLDVINKVDLFEDIKLLTSIANDEGIKTITMTMLEAYPPAEKLKYLTPKEFIEV